MRKKTLLKVQICIVKGFFSSYLPTYYISDRVNIVV